MGTSRMEDAAAIASAPAVAPTPSMRVQLQKSYCMSTMSATTSYKFPPSSAVDPQLNPHAAAAQYVAVLLARTMTAAAKSNTTDGVKSAATQQHTFPKHQLHQHNSRVNQFCSAVKQRLARKQCLYICTNRRDSCQQLLHPPYKHNTHSHVANSSNHPSRAVAPVAGPIAGTTTAAIPVSANRLDQCDKTKPGPSSKDMTATRRAAIQKEAMLQIHVQEAITALQEAAMRLGAPADHQDTTSLDRQAYVHVCQHQAQQSTQMTQRHTAASSVQAEAELVATRPIQQSEAFRRCLPAAGSLVTAEQHNQTQHQHPAELDMQQVLMVAQAGHTAGHIIDLPDDPAAAAAFLQQLLAKRRRLLWQVAALQEQIRSLEQEKQGDRCTLLIQQQTTSGQQQTFGPRFQIGQGGQL